MPTRARPDHGKDNEQKPDSGGDLGEPQPTAGSGLGRQFDERLAEHAVGQDGAAAAAGDLCRDVRHDVAGADPPEGAVGERHDGIEMGTGDGAEGQDDGDEAHRRGRRILKQLEADVAGRQALRRDPGPDHDRGEERGAEELGERPAPQRRPCRGAGRAGRGGVGHG